MAIGVLTMLAATSAIIQASPARAATSFYVGFAGSNGELYQLLTTGSSGGTATDLGFPVVSGTSPAQGGGQFAATSPVPGGQELFIDPWPTANEGDGALGVIYDDTTIEPAPGTSPSDTFNFDNAEPMRGVTDPYYVAAINSSLFAGTDHLVLVPNNPDVGRYAGFDTGLAMAPGSSPAVASTDNTVEVPGTLNGNPYTFFYTYTVGEAGFQGSNGDLWISQWGGGVATPNGFDTGLAMAAGTSPTVTADNSDSYTWGFATVIHATSGHAVVTIGFTDENSTRGVTVDSGLTIATGGTPAIASDGTSALYDGSLNPAGHIEAAFTGTNGHLITWVPSTGTHVDTGLVVASGTSPVIGYVSGNYEVAFHGSNGDLWFYNSASGATDSGFAMAAGSSPAF